MTRKVIFTPDDYWTNPPPKENPMTDQPLIDLNNFIRLHLEDDGLRVGLIPHDGGIAILLTLTTDLGKFVVGLSPGHLQVLWAVLNNVANFTTDEYKAAYDQLLEIAQQEEQS